LTTKYWRVRHKGSLTGNSEWSDPTSFETTKPLKFVYLSDRLNNGALWDVSSGAPVLTSTVSNIRQAVFSEDGLAMIGPRGASGTPYITVRLDPVTGVVGQEFGSDEFTQQANSQIQNFGRPLRVFDDLFIVSSTHQSPNTPNPVQAYLFNSSSGLLSEVPNSTNAGLGSSAVVLRDANVVVTSHLSNDMWGYKVTRQFVGAQVQATGVGGYLAGAALTLDGSFVIMVQTNGLSIFEWDTDTAWGNRRTDLEATITASTSYRGIEIREINGNEYIFLTTAGDVNGRRYHVYTWDSTTGATFVDATLTSFTWNVGDNVVSEDGLTHVVREWSDSNSRILVAKFDPVTEQFHDENLSNIAVVGSEPIFTSLSGTFE
jgi:hypothetical protein